MCHSGHAELTADVERIAIGYVAIDYLKSDIIQEQLNILYTTTVYRNYKPTLGILCKNGDPICDIHL